MKLPPASPAQPDVASPSPSTGNALDGRRLASAAAVVMLFFVLSRATGLLREIIIGNRFGTSADLDAYLAAFRVPDLLFQLVAGGALGSAFIPTFAEYWANGDHAGAWRLFSRTLTLLTLVLVTLAAGAAIFALPLVQMIIAPGFAPAQQELTANLMRWMLVGTVVFGASGLVMGALNGLQHFLAPAAAPVFYNAAIIGGALVLGPVWGVYGLAAGAVAGAAAHLVVQLPFLWRLGGRYRPDVTWRDPGVRTVMALMGPRVLGLLFVQLHFLVNTILASGLAPGSLSALNYAWLLMLLPLGIFAQAIGTALFPTFAEQVATGRQDAMRAAFGQVLRLVFFLTIPAALGLWVLRTPLVRLLLEHGEFGPASTALVTYALQFYAVGLAAHAAVEILVRVFYALRDTWTPVLVGVGAMALNVALSLLWVGSLGHGGLALANSVATALEMLLLLALVNRRLGGLEWRALGLAVARSLGAAAVMTAVVWLGLAWLARAPGIAPQVAVWLSALGGIAVAVAIYGAMTLLLGSAEARSLPARLLRRGRTAPIER